MLKIYNSLTGKKEEFKPLKTKEVGIYVCGPTVYDLPHIGHARAAYVFDCVRRYFTYKGYAVKFVRNVTDVDDKIINKARQDCASGNLQAAAKKVADKYLSQYHVFMDALGIGRPDFEPRATEYIGRMIEFIEELIRRQCAYEAGGDVYFDVSRAQDYGALSRQSRDMMESGARPAQGEKKRNALDFALWKRAKDEEPSWDSPWGKGRPGWHIECSAMSSDILGDEFDIHAGGIDLIFPHHENEAAQSYAAGKKFARYWMHNGLLTINKEKMAKSLGNFVTVEETIRRYHPDVLKILFLQTHYSHPVDFSWDIMEEKKKAWEESFLRFFNLRKISPEVFGDGEPPLDILENKIKDSSIIFGQAMDDDFNAARALAVLFDLSNEGIKYLYHPFYDEKKHGLYIQKAREKVKVLGKILGLDFVQSDLDEDRQEEIEGKIRRRLKYKEQKDYTEADRIRKELEDQGVIVEDLKGGASWRYKI